MAQTNAFTPQAGKCHFEPEGEKSHLLIRHSELDSESSFVLASYYLLQRKKTRPSIDSVSRLCWTWFSIRDLVQG